MHGDCVNVITEFQTYSWDSKARRLGVDKPVKKNDHSMDALRYAVNDEVVSRVDFDLPMFG